MRADDFDYLLPEELIASRPSTSRESSRMMIVDRERATVRSAAFAEFTGFIRNNGGKVAALIEALRKKTASLKTRADNTQ